MVKIRGARESDMGALIRYGEKFYQSTRYVEEGLEYDPEAVENLLRQLMGPTGYVLVLDVDGEVKGFILMALISLPYNPEVVAAGELAFYIDEEYRRGKYGTTLLQYAETVAKERGARYCSMVSMETSTPRQAEALYENLGYQRTETTYTKEL